MRILTGSDMKLEEKYSYRTPVWAVAALCVLFLLLSLALFAGVFYWDEWNRHVPGFLKWFLLFLALLFLVAGLKNARWKPWIYWVADEEGLYFPSECPQTTSTRWLFVPWRRIGSITIERFHDRSRGPVIDLLLTQREIDSWFRKLKLTKAILGEPETEKGYFRVGHSNLFMKPERVVKTLEDLRSAAAASRSS